MVLACVQYMYTFACLLACLLVRTEFVNRVCLVELRYILSAAIAKSTTERHSLDWTQRRAIVFSQHLKRVNSQHSMARGRGEAS